AIRLACAYRAAFRRDVFVDLVCYRKHGHNELDDPTFTQPLMYREIAKRPTLSSAYAEKLIAEGVVDAATVRAMEAEYAQQLNAAHRRAHGPLSPVPARALAGAWEGLGPAGDDWTARTAVSRATLEQVMRSAAAVPPEFQAHPKAAKLIAERVTRLA